MDTLQNEGFQISDRELMRLRVRLKLLLRESVPRAKRKTPAEGAAREKKKPSRKKAIGVSGNGLISQLGNAILAEESSSEEESSAGEETSQQQSDELVQMLQPSASQPESNPTATSVDVEAALRKQLRQEQLQIESDEKWRTRKRRRRTRGWAGLPADAPGEPPRFPSETTIDEAKAHLSLDNKMYRELRERFSTICEQESVVKKTIAGPEKWAQIVQQLIRDSTHLSNVFQDEPEVLQNNEAVFRPKGQKALSLDVICMDVTKRLRTLENRMSLLDAKNILGLNPQQTRQARSAFAAKLTAAGFTNKHEAGEQQWSDLKQTWVNESELLTRALAQGEADPEYARKVKAVEILARDVMKRQQQERSAKDLSKKKMSHQGPGPGPAPPVVPPHSSMLTRHNTNTMTSNTTQTNHGDMPATSPSTDLQIDPSLLLAASDAAFLPGPRYHQATHHMQDDDHHEASHHMQLQHQLQEHASHHHSQNTYMSHNQTYYTSSPTRTSHPTPLPIYFRLHPHSSTPFPSKNVWLSLLHTPSVLGVHSLAMREHPDTVVLKLEGLITYRDATGDREVVVEIGDDEELGAYLGHVGGQGKATFVVMLGVGNGGGGYA